MAVEMNFDGLVGPTFNHGGFALGNLASTRNAGHSSRPLQAVLQGLEKMRALHDLGVPQAVFPPHFRPELDLARRLGFSGSDEKILARLWTEAPRVLAHCYSASPMWTANAATVCPSADAADGKVHFTPANLQNQLHRSIEVRSTQRILAAMFPSERFVIHEPLPSSAALGDEGAANHTRFCAEYGTPGLQFFVFGAVATDAAAPRPVRYPARHTKEACEALVRLHGLKLDHVVLAQQHPEVIDAGVFHNDVIAVGDRDVLLHHERAFLDPSTVSELAEKFEAITGRSLRRMEVLEKDVSVSDCVATYLFNSQIVAAAEDQTILVCPQECARHDGIRAQLQTWTEDPNAPIDGVVYRDVRQSMQGGGGPACLRLRVVLTEEERADLPPRLIFGPELHTSLKDWAHRHYRTTLSPEDLADPNLIQESQQALDELTQILGLGSLYDFQREE